MDITWIGTNNKYNHVNDKLPGDRDWANFNAKSQYSLFRNPMDSITITLRHLEKKNEIIM